MYVASDLGTFRPLITGCAAVYGGGERHLDGRCVRTLDIGFDEDVGYRPVIDSVVWASDCKHVVTRVSEGPVRCFDITTGECVWTALEEGDDRKHIVGMYYREDLHGVVVVTDYGKAKLRNIDTGECCRRWDAFQDHAWSASVGGM